MSSAVQSRVAREALSGRVPILGGERIYTKYSTFLWTTTAFAAATWAFLVGGALPFVVGDTKLGLLGLVCGYAASVAVVLLAGGLSSYRYGVDTIDAAKASFGRYGMVVPLLAVLATLVGWTYVLAAMTARGTGNVIQTVRGAEAVPAEGLIIGIAVLALVGTWLAASKGPGLFERLSNWIAPAVLAVSAVMLGVLIWKFGLNAVWTTNPPAEYTLGLSKALGFVFAFEFGVASGLTWWPAAGSLGRLVSERRHVAGPFVVGITLLGGAFVTMVASFGAVLAGTPDPTIWIVQLGGSVVGSLSMAVIMLANVATMVIMIYMAGVAVQQIPVLSRLRWELVIGLLTLPGIVFAFRTEWLLSKVMEWLNYNGLMFAGLAGITLVDYVLLRRQRLDVAHLFAHSASGKYWFWGGVNWVAVAVIAASVAFYFWMYDPLTLEIHPAFEYLGAGLPTVLLSTIAYYVLTRLITIPLGKGGYPTGHGADSSVQTTDEAALRELRVGL